VVVTANPFKSRCYYVHKEVIELFSLKVLQHNFNLNFLCSLSDLAQFIHDADEGLQQPVKEGDYQQLVNVMGYLMNVKERQLTTDDMFEPLRQTIELLKFYDQELPEEVNVLLQVTEGSDAAFAQLHLLCFLLYSMPTPALTLPCTHN
jgi:dynein heavy chain